MIRGCEYTNSDLIASTTFCDWNSPDAISRAVRLATDLRYQCVQESKSNAPETVFSSAEKIEFVDKALKAGFSFGYFSSALITLQFMQDE